MVKAFRGAQQEAFSKDSEVVRVTQWAYCKGHKVIFEQEGSYDLTSVFWQMARDTILLNSEIHEVQEVWIGQGGLKATNCATQPSLKDIQFFCMVSLNKSHNIVGLRGVHSLETLHQQGGHSFCPCCVKEGQNEGTVMNHLKTMHYHLGLVCALCVDFFSTSADTMMWYAHICRSITATKVNDWEEEESKNYNDGNKDDDYLLEEA